MGYAGTTGQILAYILQFKIARKIVVAPVKFCNPVFRAGLLGVFLPIILKQKAALARGFLVREASVITYSVSFSENLRTFFKRKRSAISHNLADVVSLNCGVDCRISYNSFRSLLSPS